MIIRAVVATCLSLAVLSCGSDHRAPTPDQAPQARAPRPNPDLPPRLTDQVIIAHRGASGHAPEHTLAAYDLAIRMGADYIEQDVITTADGVLVCIHDETLDRTARGPVENCTGRVADKTLAQLKTCDMGRWFNERYPEQAQAEYVDLRIPTLEEVFQRYGDTTQYYIEIKPGGRDVGIEQSLLELIKRHGLYEGMVEQHQVLVQSFVPASLQALHRLDARVPLVQLSASDAELSVPKAAAYSVGFGPAMRQVTPALVEQVRQSGMALHPYTVNSDADLEAAAALCVDGLFTDFPDRYRAVLARTDYACPPPRRH